MKPSLHHIGIAVSDLMEAKKIYGETLGLDFLGEEVVPSEKVKVAIFANGDSQIELLEPTDSDSTIAQFLASGRKGIHHIALRVKDLDSTLKKYEESGGRVIPPRIRPGAHGTSVAFLHPRSTEGVLIELVEEE